jgi:tetratricopeptide (TPR) repeat protein
MRIEKKLLVTVVAPITVALIIALIVNVVIVKNASDDWVQDVRMDLINKKIEGTRIRTEDKANLSQLMFGKSIYNMDLLAAFGNFVDVNSFVHNYPLYYDVLPLGSAPGPLTTTEKDERQHNTVHSGWFKTGMTSALDITTHETTYGNWSNLDNPFFPLYESNKDYLNVYWGAEENGHYQTEPWTKTNFDVLTYLSFPNKTATVGYDPRKRVWYYEAYQNPGVTIVSNPYHDALTGKVLITMARYSNSSYPGEGVYGLDIYLDDLSDAITGTKILQNGKFYLVSTSGVGVLYPDIDLDNIKQFVDIEFTNTNDKTDFDNNVWPQILTNDGYTGEFTKDGNKWIILTQKLIPSDLNVGGGFFKSIDVERIDIPFIIMAIVPQSDIEAVADDIESDANKNISTMLGIGIVVIIIFIILATIGIHYFSKKITKPLLKFQMMMNSIRSGDLEQNLGTLEEEDFQSSSDMTSLSKSVRNLFVIFRSGNEKYWKGDYQACLDNYDEVEKISNGNQRTLGSLENNRGVVNQKLKNYETAYYHYEKSIKIAQELSEEAITDVEKQDYRKMYLRRRSNLANLGVSMYETEKRTDDHLYETNKIIDETLNDCQKDEDMMGVAQILAARGRLMSIRGNEKEALRCYEEAYNLIVNFQITHQAENPEKFAEQRFSLEHATLKLAEYYYNQAESTGTVADYDTSLRYIAEYHSRNIDVNVPKDIVIKALTIQLQTAKALGKTDFVNGLKDTINKIPELCDALQGGTSNMSPKSIDLTIDVSGSMSGSKINAVHRSIHYIYDNAIGPNDSVCITTFSTILKHLTGGGYVNKEYVKSVISIPRQNNYRFNNEISGHWGVGGVTAFYEALHYNLTKIYNKQFCNPGDTQVHNLMILTDGSDNQQTTNMRDKNGHQPSIYTVKQEIINMIKTCRINLMIFTIGTEYDEEEIKQYVETAESTPGCKGYHLKAGDDADSIKEQFDQVAKVLTDNDLHIESIA